MKTLAFLALLPALAVESGLAKGEMVTPFHPQHIAGPNKGSDACPPCTYGNRPQVQVWVNGDEEANIKGIQKALSGMVAQHKASELKGFVIVLTRCQACVDMAQGIADSTKFENIALATLPYDNSAVKNYKVNTDSEVKNTIFVYKDKKVVEKFVNLKADEKGLKALHSAVAKVTAK